jgi:very-short-patch-repair endonuclease
VPERINPPLPTRSRELARDLRVRQTDAEARLWYHLRSSRLGGAKFRRQHPIPPYVVDFYCDSAKLAIELDGSQHALNVDAARTRFIDQQGIEVLRFWDNDVLCDTHAVLARILELLHNRTLTPAPSPGGRGEKSEQRST